MQGPASQMRSLSDTPSILTPRRTRPVVCRRLRQQPAPAAPPPRVVLPQPPHRESPIPPFSSCRFLPPAFVTVSRWLNPPNPTHPTNQQLCDYTWFTRGEPNPRPVVGALVGGPDPSDIYRDDRSDARNNEVGGRFGAVWWGGRVPLQMQLIGGEARGVGSSPVLCSPRLIIRICHRNHPPPPRLPDPNGAGRHRLQLWVLRCPGRPQAGARRLRLLQVKGAATAEEGVDDGARWVGEEGLEGEEGKASAS
jgi:hypothetical protein